MRMGGAVVPQCFLGSGEGKVLLHILDVSVRDERALAEVTLALAILALEQVSLALFPTQDLPGACHLETLGDSLTGLCFS